MTDGHDSRALRFRHLRTSLTKGLSKLELRFLIFVAPSCEYTTVDVKRLMWNVKVYYNLSLHNGSYSMKRSCVMNIFSSIWPLIRRSICRVCFFLRVRVSIELAGKFSV